VKLGGSIAIEAFTQQIIQFVKSDVIKKDGMASLQRSDIDVSLVRYICCLVETVVCRKSKTDSKVDKREIVTKVYESLQDTPLDVQKKEALNALIDNLHSMGGIKAVTYWRKFRKFMSHVFKTFLA